MPIEDAGARREVEDMDPHPDDATTLVQGEGVDDPMESDSGEDSEDGPMRDEPIGAAAVGPDAKSASEALKVWFLKLLRHRP